MRQSSGGVLRQVEHKRKYVAHEDKIHVNLFLPPRYHLVAVLLNSVRTTLPCMGDLVLGERAGNRDLGRP